MSMRTLLPLLMAAVGATCAVAQAPPPAPMPSQISAGKKAFISNASGVSAVAKGVAQHIYNEFYAAMKSWGKYELVETPADADMVIEIRLIHNFSSGEQLRATILDPKTHVVLWAFAEEVPVAARQSTWRKNRDVAMRALVNDVRELAGQPAGATAQR
jgi:hypothetical protein